MHTDEYEISLSRELSVCEKELARIEKALSRFEKRYGLRREDLIAGYGRQDIALQEGGPEEWTKQYEALKKWQKLRDQYADLLKRMKI